MTIENDDDPALQDAVRHISLTCTHYLGSPNGGLGSMCGKPVTLGVLDRKNLVADRIAVGQCPDGHEQHQPVIE